MLRLFERAPEPAHLDVAHNGEIYRVALKPLAAVAPLHAQGEGREPRRALDDAGARLAEGGAGIRRASFRLDRREARAAAAPRRLRASAKTPLRGIDHTIVHRPGARGVVWLEAGEHGPLICVAGEQPHVPRRVADFFKREALKDIEAAVARHARAIGVKPKRIAVRDTVSRWGSCSSSGRLSFSWRLILAPPFVLDYLAAHEVAHMVHMNHSPKFWSLLRRAFPDTNRAEAWLKAHGADLHRYGAE